MRKRKYYYDLRGLGLYAILHCTPLIFVASMGKLYDAKPGGLQALEVEMRQLKGPK